MNAQARSEHHVATSGAAVEVGILVHEGHEFSALGSIVDEERGFVVGYPKGDRLQTWDGADMGITLRVVSTWRTPWSWYSRTQSAYQGRKVNATYHGRGAGDGSILRLYRCV